ncbi:M20/M25/M40 family metallo-hydrolase [Hymenobacter sp. J193]|uniref:M28 family metallopeptidase n=1 Tax=Hymenobacter sp. J193 TaxID=2898429 RepID=UPI0021517D6F|nr:M20/M25/M40 family metallo-hydrolase [Hymenobacter sp. J193]MCR5888492.1 M20/M25/M40 family metallo-hydrolase [Hymenobacter sp. J193]
MHSANRLRIIRSSPAVIGALVTLLAAQPAPAQDMDRVRRTISVLTSPKLHGRGYTHHGDQRAAAYIAKRFRQLGLQAWQPDYRQPFPLTVNTFSEALKVSVGRQALQPGIDFIPHPTSGSFQGELAVVYFDTLAFTQTRIRNQFLQQDLRQKALVYEQRIEARLRQEPEFKAKLAAVSASIALTAAKLTASVADNQATQVRLLVRTQAWPAQAQHVRLDVTARLQQVYQTQNVLGYVPGTAFPDSFLVVTAHYDHLGELGGRAYFPGANDNASGTAMLLELAAHFAQPANRLRYSVAFIAFSGEEAGLLGSQYFVANPAMPLSSIRFLLNLDLVGTGEEGITVVNGKVHSQEYQLLQQLNTSGVGVGSIAARGRAANSDHFPFSEQGVPAFFWYTRGGTAAYHDVHDKAEALPLTAFPRLVNLARQFLQRLSRTI